MRSPTLPRLLWVLPKWPLPATDGARVANVSLLRGLTALGVTIDVVAVAEPAADFAPEELKAACGVSSVRVVRRAPIGRGLALIGKLSAFKSFCLKPWLPVTLAPFAAGSVRAQLADILSRGPAGGGAWSGIVYDGLHPAAHAARFAEYEAQGIPAYYRAHNVEAEIWRRKAQTVRFLPLRLFFRLQAFLMARFEASVVRASAAVLSVSAKDLEAFRRDVPGLRGRVVPIGFDFGRPSAPPSDGPFRLLFLAKLDWPPNRDGLTWFLERVWRAAKARRPELELWIAGSGEAGWLASWAQEPGVRLLGRVENVEEVYRDCALSIVPIFYGSGTRVKAIESSRYSRPCLSTEIGVEGLGLTPGGSYFKAESEEQWIAALAGLDPALARSVGTAARELLKDAFDLPAAAGEFLKAIAG